MTRKPHTPSPEYSARLCGLPSFSSASMVILVLPLILSYETTPQGEAVAGTFNLEHFIICLHPGLQTFQLLATMWNKLKWKKTQIGFNDLVILCTTFHVAI